MTEIILTSSVLILLLIVLRRVLRERINPVLQYALWLLAAVRLLVPGTIFQTPLSVVGAAEKLQSIQAVVVTGVEGDGYIDPARPDGPTANFAIQPADGSVVSFETHPAGQEPPKNDGPTANFVILPPVLRNTLNWLDLIWKTGIAVTGGILAVSNLLFYVKLRKNRKLLELPQADYAGNLKVYQMDGLPSPCLFGLVKPAIYLNERALFSGRLDHILTHEYTHYRHGDHFWAVLRSVCLAVHWYNPLVWWAAVLSRRDCELACDEAAIRRLGEDQRIDYGQTLLGMVAKRSPASLLHMATTMTAGKRAMKERIALIAKAPQMRKITILAVVLASFLLISCAFGGAAQAPSEPASVEPGLLEFPGLHWNDSIETVIASLNISDSQIMENTQTDEDAGMKIWLLAVRDLPCFGSTAQYAAFRFIQYPSFDRYGLSAVWLDFPEDTEFSSVREGLAASYGPGHEEFVPYYAIVNGEIETISSDPELLSEADREQRLGERYSRWNEIHDQPGPHYYYWTAGRDALPEGAAENISAYLTGFEAQKPTEYQASAGTIRQFLDQQTYAQITWTDTSWGSWSGVDTFNQVTFDGQSYVLYLQNAASSVPEPAEPDALSAVLARLHELESEETIGYNFSSKFGAPANGGYKPEDILPVLEKAFRDCQWTIAEEHPPTEYIVGDIRESSLDLMDQFPYWQKVTIGCFTFFDGHPYVLCYNGEGYDWYYVPEGWITVQSALMSDWYQSGQKYGYLYQEARDIWRSFQNGWLWERYSGKFEDEQGTWYSVGFFESIEDMRGYLQTLFVPEVAEELLNMQNFCDHDGHLCVLEPPEAPGNIYAGGESYSYSILSPEDQEKYGYTGSVTAYTEVLDEDLETVLGEASWTFRFKWNGTHNVFLNFGPIDDIDPEFFHNGEYIVEQYIQGVSPRKWISRLTNLNWQDVGKAAVAAGLDTGDGTLGVVEVMWAVSEYIRDHGEDLTGSDYLAILTATEGLDGAPAESYEMLVYRLYAADPKRFAQVVLQELPQPPDPSQNTILNFLRHEWVYHQDPPMQEINLPGMKKVLQDLLAGTEAG